MAETEGETPKKSKKKAAENTRPVDPMIEDPDAVQQETFAGTTSDAATRAEGTEAKDVPSDPDNNPDKATDAEDYGFPPGGDVDIATVPEGSGDEPYLKRLNLEDWVILEGNHADVPDALDGHRAVVINVEPKDAFDDHDLLPRDRADEVYVTVRTRDSYNATLYLPLDAFREMQPRLSTDKA